MIMIEHKTDISREVIIIKTIINIIIEIIEDTKQKIKSNNQLKGIKNRKNTKQRLTKKQKEIVIHLFNQLLKRLIRDLNLSRKTDGYYVLIYYN